MATKITHFLHHNPVTGSEGVTNAFQLSCVHEHDLQANLPDSMKATNFFGIVDSLQVYLTNVAGAAKVTMRLCEDAAGDVVIVPDTEADLVFGLTTTNTGNAVFKVQTIIRQDLGGPGNGSLYLFVKLDAGTATFAGSECFWQE